MDRLGVGAAIVDGDVVAGDVEVVDGRVAQVGLAPAGTGLAVPGFVEVHTNGIAGVDFATATADGYRRAAAELAATGVLAYQAAVVSAPVEAMCASLAVVREAMAERAPGARLLGAHLEGPFLSPARAGAHRPRAIVAPDLGVLERLLAAGPVTMVTLAPEEPGATGVIERLVELGIVVSAGHSDADGPAADAAFDLGVSAVTHLFNAMAPISARRPGLAATALTRPDVFVQLIVDGVHLADAMVMTAWRTAGERCVLVTDATAAATLADGPHDLGGRTVHLADGAVRLDDGTLAGSCLTMDAAIRNAVDLGIPLVDAINAATRAPAALLRRPDLGCLRPGGSADLVVLDDDLTIQRVLAGGAVLER